VIQLEFVKRIFNMQRLLNALRSASFDDDRLRTLSVAAHPSTMEEMASVVRLFSFDEGRLSAVKTCIESVAEGDPSLLICLMSYDEGRTNMFKLLLRNGKMLPTFDMIIKVIGLYSFDDDRLKVVKETVEYLRDISDANVAQLSGKMSIDDAKKKVYTLLGRRYPEERKDNHRGGGGGGGVRIGGVNIGSIQMSGGVIRINGQEFRTDDQGNMIINGQRMVPAENEVPAPAVAAPAVAAPAAAAAHPIEQKEAPYVLDVPTEQAKDEVAKEGQPTCVICAENKICTVCLPCGHQVFCNGCARKFKELNPTKDKAVCPHCRISLTKIMTTFM